MTEQPNPADFSADDRRGEYEVRIYLEGYIKRTIKADSQEDAEAKAEALADDIAEDRETAELDEVDDIEVKSCRRPQPMFRVLRDGKAMQTTRLLAGDLPREPDARGF